MVWGLGIIVVWGLVFRDFRWLPIVWLRVKGLGIRDDYQYYGSIFPV